MGHHVSGATYEENPSQLNAIQAYFLYKGYIGGPMKSNNFYGNDWVGLAPGKKQTKLGNGANGHFRFLVWKLNA